MKCKDCGKKFQLWKVTIENPKFKQDDWNYEDVTKNIVYSFIQADNEAEANEGLHRRLEIGVRKVPKNSHEGLSHSQTHWCGDCSNSNWWAR